MSTSPSTPRREFLGSLAISAAALAAAACAPAAIASPSAAPAPSTVPPATPAPRPAPVKFDDKWVARITGKHKAVFDAPDIADGTVVGNAAVYYAGYKNVYDTTDADMSLVLVMRHEGIPLVFDDYVWEKYPVGKMAKIKDDAGKKWVTRNPFWKPTPGQPANPYNLEALNTRGAILIGCNLAARGFASELASKEKTKELRAEVIADIMKHLIPGVTLTPSGVFAVMRAQEAGCTYIRST